MTPPTIVGNWKMHPLVVQEATSLAEALCDSTDMASAIQSGVRVILCPPFTALHAVHTALEASKVNVGRTATSTSGSISLGAQNCHHDDSGAYTGEISAAMLADLGCSHVIVGHSERRRYQFETDELIGLKALRAVAHNLTPIICIGESLDERLTKHTIDVLRSQIDGVASTAGLETLTKCIIAYEPVWAIGTGQAASVSQVDDTHNAIKRHLLSTHGLDLRVLYGGSVTAENAEDLLKLSSVNGALVGGASLKAKQFADIVRSAAVRA
ncbi:MAG: triose-phosphate isomerase [bacterium]|nr:triose-phosphate isomerase [bacterium]